jgi:DNA modification methylase
MKMSIKILQGNCLETLSSLEEKSVNTCVTSPPYWGLRDYGNGDQLGQEETPEKFVESLVNVFREVRRVLRDDGTVWLNLGDSYNGSGGQGTKPNIMSKEAAEGRGGKAIKVNGIKPKDLIGIPWRVAFALQADGWYLRQDIIWSKPNPMPESVTDRCTKAHEYIFLLSKSPKYYYDNEAIKEDSAESSKDRLNQDIKNQKGSIRVPGKTNGTMNAVGGEKRNKRSVWAVRYAILL